MVRYNGLNKIPISTKLGKPICETRVPKLVFITIPCLKFWAQDFSERVYIYNGNPEIMFEWCKNLETFLLKEN